MTATADCERPDCRGCSADGTGFCRVTGRPVPAPRGGTLAESPPTAGTRRRRATDGLFTVGPAGDGPLDLPVVGTPSPEDLVVTDQHVPPGGRICGRHGCTTVVGRSYAGQPALIKGYCPTCGHPFDFTPQLAPGDLVGEQYRVVGCIANGGLGWVYLAKDIHLRQRPVALKGLIHKDDPVGLREERDHLTRLDHPGIVRIINYVTYPGRSGAPGDEGTDYIVMEFVGGMSLSQVRDRITRREGPFGEPRVFEYVLAYGCHILEALDYLHRDGLVYCDLKPNNVMHHGKRVKLIDLGGVRVLGRNGGPVLGARGYLAPEVAQRLADGLSVRSDLFSAGMTLRALSDEAAERPPGLGEESYERAVARATAAEPLARFPSARDMAEQLRGVLREIRSLRTGEELPEPSTLFAPTAALLDASLGRVPPLERWLSGPRRPLLDTGLPAPERVPLDLPVPYPHPDDPAAALLAQPTTSGPARLIQQLSASGITSPEIALRQCRAHLELGELDAADERLAAATAALDPEAAPHDWRIKWHRGLLGLARRDTDAAEREFDRVYSDLPGEYAPKLALGYCAERRGDTGAAERFYQAVWRRNRSQGSAAFGLARLRLGDGDRTGAVDLLSGVPEVSRHHDAARTACVRVLAGRLCADQGRGLPGLTHLTEAFTRLPRLYLDEGHRTGPARDRLEAELLDVALDWIRADTTPAEERAGGGLFGTDDEEFTIRGRLEQKLRGLARQAGTPAGLGTLVDLANRVRPKTRF
ncbi:serine/threonine-protein kinase [Streptomyces sp. ISL-11]|uniref:serine/threonine-protein kinase n=1 Tax=Streptomyces sp. ISL-11 TaxID=2819174 RepID=UPI001BE8F830|nr:serine/threonine-protein kinase [Streptomyces sp. ISL-11]MBT2382146.1 protein kinase [Streptomyces sp. ISL-11]